MTVKKTVMAMAPFIRARMASDPAIAGLAAENHQGYLVDRGDLASVLLGHVALSLADKAGEKTLPGKDSAAGASLIPQEMLGIALSEIGDGNAVAHYRQGNLGGTKFTLSSTNGMKIGGAKYRYSSRIKGIVPGELPADMHNHNVIVAELDRRTTLEHRQGIVYSTADILRPTRWGNSARIPLMGNDNGDLAHLDRHWINIDHSPMSVILLIIDEIVKDIEHRWKHREENNRICRAIAEAAAEEIAKDSSGTRLLHAIVDHVMPYRGLHDTRPDPNKDTRFSATFLILGADLEEVEWTAAAGAKEGPEKEIRRKLASQLQVQRRRRKRLDEAVASGTKRVDVVALKALIEAGVDPSEYIDRPTTRKISDRAIESIDAPIMSDKISFSWRDGLLRCRFGLQKGAWWNETKLIVSSDIPQTMRQALKGKPLSMVIDHPWLSEGIVIKEIRNMPYGDNVSILCDVAARPVTTKEAA